MVLAGPPAMAGRRAGDAGGWLARKDLPHRHHRRPDGCDVALTVTYRITCRAGSRGPMAALVSAFRARWSPGLPRPRRSVFAAHGCRTCVNQRDPPASLPGRASASPRRARPTTDHRPIRIRNGRAGVFMRGEWNRAGFHHWDDSGGGDPLHRAGRVICIPLEVHVDGHDEG